MLDDFTTKLQNFLALMQANFITSLIFIAILWGIFFLTLLSRRKLLALGIYPRTLHGLVGIPFYSFLHVDFNHIFFNSIPLFVLIDFLLTQGMLSFVKVSISIILISGIGIWLFGRKAIHVGASSLVMGYFSYLLVNAYRHPTTASIIIALICVYYFGGLILNLFPREEKVSWEGHICGFLAGIITAYFVV